MGPLWTYKLFDNIMVNVDATIALASMTQVLSSNYYGLYDMDDLQ